MYTGCRHERRRFSGTVGTDQTDHFVAVHGDGDATDGAYASVIGMNVSKFKHRQVFLISCQFSVFISQFSTCGSDISEKSS